MSSCFAATSSLIPDFLLFVCCDYLVSTNSYTHVGVCVGNRSNRHDADSQKNGRHNRMSPTCRDDISDMSATDKNVCRLRGVADRQHLLTLPAKLSSRHAPQPAAQHPAVAEKEESGNSPTLVEIRNKVSFQIVPLAFKRFS